jgi:acyl-CoA thioester hydrolase
MERAELRVIYGDTDQMGIVYYANYLRFFEAARNEFTRAKGLRYSDLESRHRLMLPVTEASVHYRQPARYDDLLVVEIALAHVRRATLRFDYRVLRDEELLVTGETVHACVGLDDGRIQRIPKDVLERLRAGERNQG